MPVSAYQIPTDEARAAGGAKAAANLSTTDSQLTQSELTAALETAEGSDREAATAAAILDLVTALVAYDDLKNASSFLANRVRQHLTSDRVAVGLRRAPNRPCRLLSISEVADLDRSSDYSRAAEAALQEIVLNDRILRWPPLDGDAAQGPAPALQNLAQLSNSSAIVGGPLGADGNCIGAWLIWETKPPAEAVHSRQFLNACVEPIGASLHAVQRASRSRWCRLPRIGPFTSWRRLSLLAVALLTALLLPWPHQIVCNCEIQPVVRRFVSAPFEGVFAQSLVKPGDVVARDQIIGKMDGREVRWELAGLEAEAERAGKSRDVNLATNKVAAAQIDKLEMERIALRQRILKHRAENLDIKSPIEGVIISGDLERSEGVSVSVGQPLFEVAPLDRMVVEVAIPEDEIAHVATGRPVLVQLDAYPGSTWSGELARIHPRSESYENHQVFMAEVNLDNSTGLLRPGMKGRAQIAACRRTLGWIIFHKPWNRLAAWAWW